MKLVPGADEDHFQGRSCIFERLMQKAREIHNGCVHHDVIIGSDCTSVSCTQFDWIRVVEVRHDARNISLLVGMRERIPSVVYGQVVRNECGVRCHIMLCTV